MLKISILYNSKLSLTSKFLETKVAVVKSVHGRNTAHFYNKTNNPHLVIKCVKLGIRNIVCCLKATAHSISLFSRHCGCLKKKRKYRSCGHLKVSGPGLWNYVSG